VVVFVEPDMVFRPVARGRVVIPRGVIAARHGRGPVCEARRHLQIVHVVTVMTARFFMRTPPSRSAAGCASPVVLWFIEIIPLP
jgi:hypothetical protein